MCGILFTIDGPDDLRLYHCAQNARRGPDAQRSVTIGDMIFSAFELRLRGEYSKISQPHEREGDVFCWNGEVFEGLEINSHENDGRRLFDELRDVDGARDVFARIEGPYAFVLYLKSTNELVYGRDPLGRRSLLVHRPSEMEPYFALSSVSRKDACFEDVDPTCLHVLSLSTRSTRRLERTSPGAKFGSAAGVNRNLPSSSHPLPFSQHTIPVELSNAVDGLISRLSAAVKVRVQTIPPPAHADQARLGVLFSGGIDCTFITYLAHQHLPISEPIDLLNVAFENPRKLVFESSIRAGKKLNTHKIKKLNAKGGSMERPPADYAVPDRKTGWQAVEELRRVCPGRQWNFVEVNVPYEEAIASKPDVLDLMWPNRTVMDLSLAQALYFASRGVGQLHPSATPYTSSARVLLNGLGSDELMGGYKRHLSAFHYGGWPALVDELQTEVDQIPSRNLGRDDRVVASHGKETRHPYLSLDVLVYLAGLDVWLKVDPRVAASDVYSGVNVPGDKMLLRLASQKVGLVQASTRRKRAMQFGSHSARMENDGKGDVVLGTEQ